MAINRRAKNIYTQIEKTYTSISGSKEIITKRLFVNSTKEDLDLISNKKVIIQGNKSE